MKLRDGDRIQWHASETVEAVVEIKDDTWIHNNTSYKDWRIKYREHDNEHFLWTRRESTGEIAGNLPEIVQETLKLYNRCHSYWLEKYT